MTEQVNDNVESVATQNPDADSQFTHEQEQPTDTPEQKIEGEEGKQEETQPEPEPPKKSRAQERIEQTTRENAELRRKLAEYEAKTTQPELKRPQLDDFESYSDYEDALEDYQVAKAEQRILDKLNQSKSDEAKTAQQVEMQTAIAEIEDSGVDFQAYAAKAETLPPLPVTLDQFGLSAKEALLLGKDLLDNEDTYLELSQMNPHQFAMRIGQMIESKKTVKPNVPPASKAPPPIKPVQGSTAAKRDYFSLSDDEIMKGIGI